MGLRAIFFDAGNTLVFPDRQRTLAPLLTRGICVTEEQIRAAERAARRFRDTKASPDPASNTDQQYWVVYYQELLAGISPAPVLMSELVAAARNSSNWKSILPGTRETLLRLKQNYRLGIISNSDGQIADLFDSLGLRDCFETITDSGVVGHQKPHPEIFRAALESLQLQPQQTAYVGDVYSIDYAGARSVGMHAILMDLFDTYRQNGYARVKNLAELEALLASGWRSE